MIYHPKVSGGVGALEEAEGVDSIACGRKLPEGDWAQESLHSSRWISKPIQPLR